MTTEIVKYGDAGRYADRTDGRVRRKGAKISSEAADSTLTRKAMCIN